jgi:signal transduction histidine kinase
MRLFRFRSIRTQVSLAAAAVFGIGMAAVGIGTAFHLYRERVRDIDNDIREEADRFFERIETTPAPDWQNIHGVEDLLEPASRAFWVEISSEPGAVLFRSLNSDSFRFPGTPQAQPLASVLERGHHYRMGGFSRNGLTIRIAASLDDAEEMRDDLLLIFLIAGPIILVLGMGVGWWISRQALAPVAVLSAAADRITAENLSARLPMPQTEDEIAQLAGVLNTMIDRLERGFLQASRFTADASHQLRTPLTILRGELEAALRAPECTPATTHLILPLLESVERLSRMVEKMLLLSHADAGRLQLSREPVPFSLLMDEALDDAELLAAPNGIRVERAITPGLTVPGDAPFLEQVALNLIENAVKYNEPGGILRASLQATEKGVELVIANTGPEIAPHDVPLVFERFHRSLKPATSQRSIRGHGLGLSICRELVEAHGGTIQLCTEEKGWTKFTVTLPRC